MEEESQTQTQSSPWPPTWQSESDSEAGWTLLRSLSLVLSLQPWPTCLIGWSHFTRETSQGTQMWRCGKTEPFLPPQQEAWEQQRRGRGGGAQSKGLSHLPICCAVPNTLQVLRKDALPTTNLTTSGTPLRQLPERAFWVHPWLDQHCVKSSLSQVSSFQHPLPTSPSCLGQASRARLCGGSGPPAPMEEVWGTSFE